MILFTVSSRLTSRCVSFYKVFFQGLKGEESQTKLYSVKQGADKGFPKPKYGSEVMCNWFTEDALTCSV